MVSGQWFQRKISFKIGLKFHKIAHNSMKNTGSNTDFKEYSQKFLRNYVYLLKRPSQKCDIT